MCSSQSGIDTKAVFFQALCMTGSLSDPFPLPYLRTMAADPLLQHAMKRRIELYPEEVRWDGVVRHTGWVRMLGGFLRDNPNRKADLLHAMPAGAEGVVAHGAMRDGRLWIERVSVPGAEDVLLDMVLWHALFPGLKAPQVVFWMSGDHVLTTDPPYAYVSHNYDVVDQLPETQLPNRFIRLDRGVVTNKPEPIRAKESTSSLPDDLFQWPLWLRVLLLPVIVLFVPPAMVVFALGGRWHKLPAPWWMLLLLPVFVVAFLFKWCAPITFERYIAQRVHGLMDGSRRRKAVKDLLQDSLRRGSLYPLRKS